MEFKTLSKNGYIYSQKSGIVFLRTLNYFGEPGNSNEYSTPIPQNSLFWHGKLLIYIGEVIQTRGTIHDSVYEV